MFLLAVAVLPGAALVVRAKEKPNKQSRRAGPRVIIEASTAEPSSATKPATELSVRTYQVSDLVSLIQMEHRESVDEARALLLLLLRSNIPGPWEMGEGRGINFGDTTDQPKDLRAAVLVSDPNKCSAAWSDADLLIRQTAAGHQQIDKQLQFWKEFGFQQLAIDVRMISGSAKVMDAIPASWQVIDAGAESDAADSLAESKTDTESVRSRVESVIEKTHPAMFAILDEAAAVSLLREAQGDARTNVLQRQRSLCTTANLPEWRILRSVLLSWPYARWEKMLINRCFGLWTWGGNCGCAQADSR